MADVYRLLIRSTNISKSARSTATYSLGSTPQIIPPPAKKRKKNATGKEYRIHSVDRLPNELDFFKTGSVPKPVVEAAGKLERTTGDRDEESAEETDEEETDEEEPGDEEGTATILPSEEETRRYLQEHKLKFSILSRGEKPVPPEKKKKKKAVVAAAEEEAKKQKKKDKKYTLPIPPLLSFADLRSPKYGYTLSKQLYANILAQGYNAPTEVQMGALPVLMNRLVSDTLLPELLEAPPGTPVDLLTCAPTGSGKTLAYVVPLLNSLLRERKLLKDTKDKNATKGVKAIILAPTKELVTQIVNEVRKLCVGTGLRVSSLKKGHVPVSSSIDTRNISLEQTQQFIKSDIVVSTPLTFLHSLSATPTTSIQDISALVLDEADILLDTLFKDQTVEIYTKLRATSPKLQTTLWSATINSSTESFFSSSSSSLTANPVLRLIVGIKDTSIPTISQKLLYTNNESGKLLAVRQLLTVGLKPPLLVFVQSVPRAQALYNELQFDLPTPGKIAVLHASLSDTAREDVMERFRNAQVWVLVTTDVLARGIDFRGVRQVVNYDLPTSVAAYIHRIGRTGRTGGSSNGEAITYFTKEDFSRGVKGIAGVIEASKKQRKKVEGEDVAEGEEGTDAQWLVDALPKTGKRQKQQMKKFGVEARRGAGAGTGEGASKSGKDAKISSKSSWQRRKEERKRGAIEGSRRRKRKMEEDQDEDQEEWKGFDD